MMKKRKNREIDESLPIRMANNIFPPPIFTTDCSSAQECLEYYKRFQILHYRLSNHQQSSYPLMSTPLKGLQAVWNVKKEIITTQWKIENYCGVYEDSLTAERIIMGSGISERSHPFYASCVIDCQTENEDSHEADENANCRDNNDTNSFAIADTFLDGYIRHPPFAKWDDFRHDDTIWVFLGKNVSSTSDHSSMQGRTEHTDFVDHTGAWHFQISGSKIWRCRPVEDSPEWGDQGAPAISECCDDKSSSISGGGSSSRSSSSISGGSSGSSSSSSSSISGSGSSISGGSSSGSSSSSGGSNDAGAGNESSGDSSSHNNSCSGSGQGRSAGDVSLPQDFHRYLSITCEEGDILMINTRLWWHETCIPSTELAAEQLSMSYARDFYCIAAAPAGGPINHKR